MSEYLPCSTATLYSEKKLFNSFYLRKNFFKKKKKLQ